MPLTKARKKRIAIAKAVRSLRSVSSYTGHDGFLHGYPMGGGYGIPRGLRQSEIKYVDNFSDGFPISETATFACVNYVVPGADFFNRTTLQITMHDLHLRAAIASTTNAAANITEYGRLLVVYDKSTNLAAPTIAAILKDYDALGAIETTPYSFQNPHYLDRYIILYDRAFASIGDSTTTGPSLAALSAIDYNKNPVNIDVHIPLKGLKTRFINSAGGGSGYDTITTGSLSVVVYGQAPTDNAIYQWIVDTRLTFSE